MTLEQQIQNFIFSINLKKYSKQLEKTFLVVLLLLTTFLRLIQLGYSDFYGDETKVFFLRKDISAGEFLLNQRKGPVQFVVAWVFEKVVGSYHEFWTRLPYSIAGILSVFVLYYFVKSIYGKRVGALAALIFSFSGFFIAFSRTVQYQSFLILFGLISVYASYAYIKHKNVKFFGFSFSRNLLLVISGVSLGLAYLTHWDAVFYDIIVGIFIFYYLYELKKSRSKELKRLVIYLVIPFLIVVTLFYLPYFLDGYFANQVVGYISRRIDGKEQLINNSSFTYWLYNPSFVFYIPFLFFPFVFTNYKKDLENETLFVLFWFLIPFIVFQFFISNPGTHIQNYILPLIILSALGMVRFYNKVKNIDVQNALKSMLLFVLTIMFVVSSYTFVPAINTGYPWTESTRGPFKVSKLEKNSNQYFIYGFPYNRGWRDVRAYFEEVGMPRSFYTNDNVTIAEFYLHGVPAHKVHSFQMPEYYIEVPINQEDREMPENIKEYYEVVHTIDLYDDFEVKIYRFLKTDLVLVY